MTQAHQILDTILAAADEQGWEQVSLRDVAKTLQVPMATVIGEYRDLDAAADAWFETARQAMTEAATQEGFGDHPPRERLRLAMEAWFDQLRSHRRVTAQMLQAKMWIFHPHHYVPAIFHLSRLIQLLRDVADLNAQGRRRQVEEIVLTNLFLITLARWCGDNSPDQEKTKRFLSKSLKRGDAIMARWP